MTTKEEKMNYLKKYFKISTDEKLIEFLINHKYEQISEWDIFKIGKDKEK